MSTPEILSQLHNLREKVRAQYHLADRISGVSFEHYLNQVIINSAPEPKRFSELAEPWQWEQARKIGPAIEAVCRVRRGYKGKRAFWRTMPRGHDKSSSIGRLMNWALAYTVRNFTAVVAAADREQAALLLEFMESEARLNPWLNKRLDFKQNKVNGRYGSNLKILAADAYGSFGLNNDILICDEVTHWANSALWTTLVSGSEKRPGSVFIVITNAGMKNDWQWKAREVARTSKEWDLYEAPGPLAKWMNSERSKDMIRMLPPSEAKRVIYNQWIDPSEDCGYISRMEAEMCLQRGIEMGLQRQEVGNPDFEYTAGVDYGPKKDRTVLTVGHRIKDSFIVDKMDVYQGKNFPDKVVPVKLVEKWIEDTNKAFPHCTFVIDPYQMEGTIQAYSGTCNIERFEPRAGKSNYEMAQILRGAVVGGRLAWYLGCGDILDFNDIMVLENHTLVDEMADLVIQNTSSGYRLQHLNGLHDDRTVSLGLACHRALGSFRRRSFNLNDRYF